MAMEIEEKMHRVRVRLRRNNLPGAVGAFLARTVSEALLSIEEICASLKNRGGFTGNYDDLVSFVKQFLEEVVYLLCNGFAVNMGYFSIHPVVGGYFDTAHGDIEPKEHPITFRFHARKPLRKLSKYIDVEIIKATAGGVIDSFFDVDSEAANKTITPGGLFIVSGDKIKVTGNHPDVGVYFVSRSDPSLRYKVTGALPGNTRSKIIGVVPPLSAGEYVIEVKTQFTPGGINLNEPRTVVSDFTLRAE